MALSRLRLPVAIALAAALSGCGNGEDPVLLEAAGAVRGAFSEPEQNNVTTPPAEIRGFPSPLLLLETQGGRSSALIGRTTQTGANTTWTSADNKTVTFRNGLVAATRGFGEDLMSADLPDLPRGGGRVVRDHWYLRGTEQTEPARFFCDVAPEGRTRIEVLDRTYPVSVLTETCRGETGSFTNTYWFDTDGGLRRSRQWISPAVGSLVVSRVQDR